MADVNRWNNLMKQEALREMRNDVECFRITARGHEAEQRGQRRMAIRILHLIDLKLSALGDDKARERLDQRDSQSSETIDKDLQA